MALSQGVQKKRKLWTKVGREELEQLPLLPYAAERRKRLLEALDGLEAEIVELDSASGGRSAAAVGGGAADDASGGGTGDGVGPGADAGAGGKIRISQTSGQLFWADSERGILERRKKAANCTGINGDFIAVPGRAGQDVVYGRRVLTIRA